MTISSSILNRTLATPLGESAYKIVETLVDNGHEAYFVGGPVRDMLMDSVPDDIDIATSAVPDEMKKLFPKHDATGEQFGNLIVSIEGQTCEVTTFREDDSASDGRHPESVVFSTKENDCMRRDFTVNAIYFNPISSEIFDPVGGVGDVKERLIRFIGDPVVRIEHDVLRMLRAVRFRSAIDGQYDPATYQALQASAPKLESLSGTRRLQEFEKMLMGPRPGRALEDMWELGLIKVMLPELQNLKGVPQPADYHNEGDVWDHSLQAVDAADEDHGIDIRIATLFHDCGKPETFARKERIRFDGHAEASAKKAEMALQRLQCPKKRIEKISWLIDHHMMMGSFADMTEERKAHWYYHPYFVELLQLFYLDIAGTTPSCFDLYEEIVSDYNRYLDANPRPKKPLLSGEEIMEILKIEPGPEIGRILKELDDAQKRNEIKTKDEAELFIQGVTSSGGEK